MEKTSTYLQSVDQKLSTIVQPVLLENSFLQNLETLSTGAEALSESLISIGDAGFEQIINGKEVSQEEDFFAHQVNYSWASQAKSYIILWRDILFQYQKAYIFFKEGKVNETQLEQLNKDSRKVLEEAATSLAHFIDHEKDLIELKRNGVYRQLQKWNIQSNPWPVYRKQIESVPDQCERLANDHLFLVSIVTLFEEIRELVLNTLAICIEDTNRSKSMINECIEIITTKTKDSEEKQLGKIINQLEQVEHSLVNENYLNTFSDKLELKLIRFPEKRSIPVAEDGGLIQLLDVNFRKKSQQWLGAEILPLLYEVWELTDNFRNRTKMTVVNIRNRVVLLQTEAKEGRPLDMEIFDIAQPLKGFAEIFEDTENDFQSLSKLINQRLKKDFYISEIYRLNEPFLPVVDQSAVSQLRLNQTKLIEDIRHWFSRNVVALYRLKKNVEIGVNLSISEKVVRYIENRKGDPENNSYTSIFLTKGYVGESFWVGRKDETRHVRTLIQNWQKGFRGAVLVTGKRLSGKSLFGELVALKSFSKETIRLIPGVPIELQSRRMEGTYDLREALNFIRKYSQNRKLFIWIDDLELWWSPETPLYENVRHLNKFIDQFANRHFFMVAMGNTLCSHLKKSHDINNVFQAEINMDYMPPKDIEEAILIRHGATHKHLVNQEEEILLPRDLKKKMRSIFKASNGNIGEALNMWAHSTKKLDEEKVINEFEKKYQFPDFDNPDTYLLLASILLQKRTNEYRLRKLFGPAFQDRYQDILRRLISIGILKRQPDEWLELEESIVNDLGQVMANKKYLNYN